MHQDLQLEKAAGRATITLDRPESLNALSIDLLSKLRQALEDVSADDDVRVVLLRGNGRAFCAGIDLKLADGFVDEASDADLRQFAAELQPILRAIEECPKPVIGLVQGFAITGGALLAYFCDFVIAAEDAFFQDTHGKWGFVPGAWETLRLPRMVSYNRAKRMFLAGERISASEMRDWGLVYSVTPAAELEAEGAKLAERIEKLSPIALRYIKKQLVDSYKLEWDAAVEQDQQLRGDLLGGFITPDADLRLKSFAQK